MSTISNIKFSVLESTQPSRGCKSNSIGGTVKIITGQLLGLPCFIRLSPLAWPIDAGSLSAVEQGALHDSIAGAPRIIIGLTVACSRIHVR